VEISLVSICTEEGELLSIKPLASYLVNSGFKTNTISLDERPYITPGQAIPSQILEQFKDLVKESELIGISCMSIFAKNAIELITYLRSYTKAKIIWGGIEATINPNKCLEYADIVCIGEGEEALCELAQAIEKKQNYLDRHSVIPNAKNVRIRYGKKKNEFIRENGNF